MNGYIKSKGNLQIVCAWDGLEVGGGTVTKQNPLLQFKAQVLKSDSVPETTFFIEKAQSVAVLLEKFKSQDQKVHKGITKVLHNLELATVETKTFQKNLIS